MHNHQENNITEVWPGPMEGVMREPFVRTVSELKLASRWMTPFFRVTTHVPKKAKVAEFLQVFLETGLPVSGQIMGTHPERLAKTAQIMLELGCFDVDINCGCPSSRVISGGAGGGILRDLDLLKNILQALRSAMPPGAFSVKTRIGYDRDRSEEVLKTILENGKPDRLFVHCRTTKEMYAPVENMSGRFDKVISLTREARKDGMSLILNGDISSVQHARLLAEKAGSCGVMCARSWMRDPGLLRRIEGYNELSPEDARELFFETLKKYSPGKGALIEAARMMWGTNSDKFKSTLKNIQETT